MKEIKMRRGSRGGVWAFVKELGTGLLAIVLFTLGFPDHVGAARAILTQGNLRLFLWLTLNKTTFDIPVDPAHSQASLLNLPIRPPGVEEAPGPGSCPVYSGHLAFTA